MGLPINPKGPTPSIVLDTGTPLKCSRSRPFSCEISTGQTVRPNCISDFCFIHEPTSMMVPLVRDRHRQTFDTTPSSGDNREVASLQHVGLWRSWERASMAWKRSSVRSRSGPPNNPFILRYLPTPPRRDLVSKGCGRVLKFLHFERQHQFNDSQARFALLLIYRAGVNIKRRAAAGMPHQLLCDLDVHAKRSQVGREGVTKTVPADMFSDNSDPRQCGTNALLQDAVRTERLIPFESN